MEQSQIVVSIIDRKSGITNVQALDLSLGEFRILNEVMEWMKQGVGTLKIIKMDRTDFYDLEFTDRRRVKTGI